MTFNHNLFFFFLPLQYRIAFLSVKMWFILICDLVIHSEIKMGVKLKLLPNTNHTVPSLTWPAASQAGYREFKIPKKFTFSMGPPLSKTIFYKLGKNPKSANLKNIYEGLYGRTLPGIELGGFSKPKICLLWLFFINNKAKTLPVAKVSKWGWLENHFRRN